MWWQANHKRNGNGNGSGNGYGIKNACPITQIAINEQITQRSTTKE